jgi:DNA repair protein RadA/Sms
MMNKGPKTIFVCQNCGAESARWLGRCPSCNSWNTLVEEIRTKTKATGRSASYASQPVLLSEIPLADKLRQPTHIKELDQVLGGGIVAGSIILIGGEPGIGKSTLTLQIANNIIKEKGKSVLYVSGEESIEQIKLRAERLGVNNHGIYLLAENELQNILIQIDILKPALVIIDSIQTVYSEVLSSSPGSVGQVRECTAEILRSIKGQSSTKSSVIIVGHITKFGAIAGPKTLEHIVDVVLYFEGDKFQQYRILRATKNRFGSTQEIGIFEMNDTGLVGVESPSLLFLSHTQKSVPSKMVGSVVIPTIEGTRPILLEVQALAAPSYFNFPQRVTTGFDIRRLAMLLCVLERHCGMNIGNHDVFLNTGGGIKITEPAADLGVIAAIASTYRNKAIDAGTAIIGEVSLSGEIRPVVQMKNRINECAKMGFNQIIGPDLNVRKEVNNKAKVKTTGVTNVSEALEAIGIIG